jgi:epoxyqueuosine reductase
VYARYAGIGWQGKNTCIINQKIGSWLFLGVIVTSLELAPDLPAPDRCGTCTRCIDACPTHAFVAPHQLDSNKCIAYLTIEKRGPIPEDFREAIGHQVFGCDICQDVCPWNRRAPVTQAPEFEPRTFSRATEGQPRELFPAASEGAGEESLFLPRLEWLAAMNEEQFRAVFRGSPIRRTKWRGMVRNACIALGNSAPASGSAEHERIRTLLKKLSGSSEPLVAESAQWALSRIQ